MLPKLSKQLVCTKLSSNFRACTTIQTLPVAPMLENLKATEVLVKNTFLAINASDINFTAGVYKPGVQPPFPAGMESMGQVVAAGPKVKGLAKGDQVVCQHYGAFGEVITVPERNCVKVPSSDPRNLMLSISGTTASIALAVEGRPQRGETALVTAAAGATGQMAVQLLKHKYGCYVIGTCSSDSKKEHLRVLGCDLPVNVKTESLDAILSEQFPKGVHVVYESVGGELFDLSVKHLAKKGRLIVIGNIVGYTDGSSWSGKKKDTGDDTLPPPIGSVLLKKSAKVCGFFLMHYTKLVPQHVVELGKMMAEGKLQCTIDPTPFNGVEAAADAVEHLHSRRNVGKVVVHMGTSQEGSKL